MRMEISWIENAVRVDGNFEKRQTLMWEEEEEEEEKKRSKA